MARAYMKETERASQRERERGGEKERERERRVTKWQKYTSHNNERAIAVTFAQ
jgi:hypothetical protein